MIRSGLLLMITAVPVLSAQAQGCTGAKPMAASLAQHIVTSAMAPGLGWFRQPPAEEAGKLAVTITLCGADSTTAERATAPIRAIWSATADTAHAAFKYEFWAMVTEVRGDTVVWHQLVSRYFRCASLRQIWAGGTVGGGQNAAVRSGEKWVGVRPPSPGVSGGSMRCP